MTFFIRAVGSDNEVNALGRELGYEDVEKDPQLAVRIRKILKEEGYRFIELGERLEIDDEYYTRYADKWHVISSRIHDATRPGLCIFRRRAPGSDSSST